MEDPFFNKAKHWAIINIFLVCENDGWFWALKSDFGECEMGCWPDDTRLNCCLQGLVYQTGINLLELLRHELGRSAQNKYDSLRINN